MFCFLFCFVFDSLRNFSFASFTRIRQLSITFQSFWKFSVIAELQSLMHQLFCTTVELAFLELFFRSLKCSKFRNATILGKINLINFLTSVGVPSLPVGERNYMLTGFLFSQFWPIDISYRVVIGITRSTSSVVREFQKLFRNFVFFKELSRFIFL